MRSRDLARWRAHISRREVLAGVAAGAAGALLPSGRAGGGMPAFTAEADVIVVGSGAAGATAALFAHDVGARVLMLEKAGHFGGTSAKSGGNVWIPNNPSMQARGLRDPKPDFLRFAARSAYPGAYTPTDEHLGIGAAAHALLATFYDEAAPTIATLNRWNAVRIDRFHFGSESMPDAPDYNENLPENTVKRGRVMAPFGPDGLGLGNELMRQFRAALDARRIEYRLRSRVVDVVRAANGDVLGAVVERENGAREALRARRGVVFASGGFTHNRDLLQRFHPTPVAGGCALATCTGDFVTIGADAGAELGNMASAWRAQVVLEDAIAYASTPNNVWSMPGDSMIMVNRHGRRVVNEKRNYHDRAKAMYAWDADVPEYPNRLLFAIYDERVATMGAGIYPLPDVPDGLPFVIRGADLAALCRALAERLAALAPYTGGLTLAETFEPALSATLTRYNEFARTGRDLDFRRGEFEYDEHYHRLLAGRSSERFPANAAPNVTMHPFSGRGPYYAIILAPGTLDTNGGPVIDPAARVLDRRGRPIPGLYGAGNCIASAAGQSYWGAGATLGNAITFGAIAGRQAARAGAST